MGILPNRVRHVNHKEKAMPENTKDPKGSIDDQIRSLRKKAETGELGDEVLEDVAGGHTDGVLHVDNPSLDNS
jgi:hypothetical protein